MIAAMKVTTPEGRAAARNAAEAVGALLDEVEETDENEDGREELWSLLTWLSGLGTELGAADAPRTGDPETAREGEEIDF